MSEQKIRPGSQEWDELLGPEHPAGADVDISSGELVALAAILAGPGASDDQVAAMFARASLLLQSGANWLCDAKRYEEERAGYVMRAAEHADKTDWLSWSTARLHEISGYGNAAPTAEERGRLLFDAVDKQVSRKFPSLLAQFREKYRKGIPEKLFLLLWPLLSKWRVRQLAASAEGNLATPRDS